MSDESANQPAPTGAPVETQAPDYKAIAAAETSKRETLEKQYKAAQRDLERERKKGGDNALLTARFDALEALLEPLIAGTDDEKVKATLAQHKQRKAETDKAQGTHRETAQRVAEILNEAGIEDPADERISPVLKAMDRGDYVSAIVKAHEAAAKPAPTKALPDVEALVKARVEEELRKQGTRKVDTGAGTPAAKPTLDSLLKVNTRTMTPAQLKEYGEQLFAAVEADTGVKIARG